MSDAIKMPFRLKPRTLIVFEGLDATGKSTQFENIERGCYVPTTGTKIFEDPPLFTHSPSGSTALGEMIYDFTEDHDIASPLARQFLHLASHAEEWETNIVPRLKGGGGVVMDRFWWSTIAYGYFGGNLFEKGVSLDLFEKIVQIPTQGYKPSIVFLFTHPWLDDPHNNERVEAGYQYLAEQHADITVPIDVGSEAEVTLQIFEALTERRLVKNGK